MKSLSCSSSQGLSNEPSPLQLCDSKLNTMVLCNFYTLFNRVVSFSIYIMSSPCHSTSNYGILIWLVILILGPIHDMGQMIPWGWRDSSIMHARWSANPINLNWPKIVVSFRQFWVFLSLSIISMLRFHSKYQTLQIKVADGLWQLLTTTVHKSYVMVHYGPWRVVTICERLRLVTPLKLC